MADIGLPAGAPEPPAQGRWFHRLVASRPFQIWAARFPLTRRIVRREGEAMFELVAGFCRSQVLLALVEPGISEQLLHRDGTIEALALRANMPPDRMRIWLNAGVAIGILRRRRAGTYGVTRRGAALTGVPGLAGMILHHRTLYRDLENPVAFFRGQTETELAGFWPYVFGAGATADPTVAQTCSQLMADSQVLVAQYTLAAVLFAGTKNLMDVGGVTGAYLATVGTAWPDLKLALFDLPAVAPRDASAIRGDRDDGPPDHSSWIVSRRIVARQG